MNLLISQLGHDKNVNNINDAINLNLSDSQKQKLISLGKSHSARYISSLRETHITSFGKSFITDYSLSSSDRQMLSEAKANSTKGGDHKIDYKNKLWDFVKARYQDGKTDLEVALAYAIDHEEEIEEDQDDD